jgi:hypothetical protein
MFGRITQKNPNVQNKSRLGVLNSISQSFLAVFVFKNVWIFVIEKSRGKQQISRLQKTSQDFAKLHNRDFKFSQNFKRLPKTSKDFKRLQGTS